MTKTLSFIALLVAANSLHADEALAAPNESYLKENGVLLSIGQVSFDSELAAREGVDDSALYVVAGWEGRYRSNLIVGAGISLYDYSDNEAFEQLTESSWGGNERNSSSSATAYNLYGELGYGVDLAPTVSLDLLAGYEMVLSSERSISYCSDCYSEDIEIDSGLFVAPRLRFKPWEHWVIALSYQSYLTGDVESSAQISTGYVF
ncbi:porin family protein [Teredinibacter turnerae]|uniref:porin family protein n=1 Tax=Teredinibacter turnerae TaxID=2426 RepID=UPI00041C6255|nr:porin family protein [Teredinibacter turnerae]